MKCTSKAHVPGKWGPQTLVFIGQGNAIYSRNDIFDLTNMTFGQGHDTAM